MRLRGRMLWRHEGAERAAWTTGEWQIRSGRVWRTEVTSGAALEGWVIPGLVDVHCHIGIGEGGAVGRRVQETQAMANRDAGVLAIRDCGVPVDDSWMKERADMPRLVRAGRHIARPMRYIRGLGMEVEPSELAQVVVEEAQRGDGWVKLVGDWIDRSDGADADLKALWPKGTLVDAVAAAHEAGARLTVHAFSHGVIDDLLEAGVDGIEHGSGMDSDQLEAARVAGVSVTPTLMQVDLFGDFATQAGAKFPRYARTMQALFEGRREHAELIFSSGVDVLPGTDAGGYQAHGTLPEELARWAAIGVDPLRILDVATWQARDELGLESLGEGAPADLVVYSRDPVLDITELSRPAAVILGGDVVGAAH